MTVFGMKNRAEATMIKCQNLFRTYDRQKQQLFKNHLLPADPNLTGMAAALQPNRFNNPKAE